MHANAPTGATVKTSTSYQWLLIGLLSFNFGIVFLDRNVHSFLGDYIIKDLKLTFTQFGWLASGLSLAWAIAGFFMGWLSDRLRRRKLLLVIATLLFSAASVLSGLAGGFLALLGARALMGIAEGGIMPISQTLIAQEVTHERRGLAQGLTQNFGANLLANFLGPIVIVAIAVAFGWRHAFMLAALPGLLSAILIMLFVREPPMESIRATAKPPRGEVWALLADRNILLCMLLSILLVAFFVTLFNFMPVYLIQVRGVDPSRMSYIMSAWGLASIAVALLVPGSSDRFGRKPVIIAAALIGLVLPLGILFTSGTNALPIMLSLGIGSVISGAFPIAMATIPSEVVKPAQMATALSLTMGTSEVIGGVFSPSLAGKLSDMHGLGAAVWLLAGLAAAIAIVAMFLRETAPVALARRAARG